MNTFLTNSIIYAILKIQKKNKFKCEHIREMHIKNLIYSAKSLF